MRRFQWILLVLLAAMLVASIAGCDADDDSDNDFDPADDDTSPDDDAADDDAVDDDVSDDDALDDDAADDDAVDDDATDDDIVFPQLDPAKCVLDDPPALAGFDPDYELIYSEQPVQDKNFYLLTLFQMVAEIAEVLAEDTAVAAISTERDGRLRTAAAVCGPDPDCYAEALIWTTPETEAMADELVRLFVVEAEADILIGEQMRPSGMFQFYAADSDEEMLVASWTNTIGWLNDVYNEYSRNLDATALDNLINEICVDNPATMFFFEPLLMVGVASMMELGRDEAGRYEPLAEGENQAAAERIPSIDWDDYRFPVMLVPGQGPEVAGVPLSPLGRWRCDIAAERYFAGLTPLIVFSGGHVHPSQTPYAESIEMKKYTMQNYDIPEDAILIDPHARHTTTNLRNLARIILRYGIPADRPALITTDFGQAIYITFMLDRRCRDELGYLPYRIVKRLSVNDSCYLPNPTSLYADANDPLDP